MQYSVKITNEARFKFSDIPNEVVIEQAEESKSISNPSEASSLMTEEDTSGNPLPPEIIKIRRKNKQMQKDLTTGMMNFKSSSRSLLNSSVSEEEEEVKKESIYYIEDKKPDVMNTITNNEPLKAMLEQIVRLQSDFDTAKKELQHNEQEIYNSESEYLSLKSSLKNIEDELQILARSRSINSSCGCSLI